MVTFMDTKNKHHSDLDDLRSKKEDLLSLFRTYETKIDSRISQLSETSDSSDKPDVFSDADAIFDQAVKRSQHHEPFTGFHADALFSEEANVNDNAASCTTPTSSNDVSNIQSEDNTKWPSSHSEHAVSETIKAPEVEVQNNIIELDAPDASSNTESRNTTIDMLLDESATLFDHPSEQESSIQKNNDCLDVPDFIKTAQSTEDFISGSDFFSDTSQQEASAAPEAIDEEITADAAPTLPFETSDFLDTVDSEDAPTFNVTTEDLSAAQEEPNKSAFDAFFEDFKHDEEETFPLSSDASSDTLEENDFSETQHDTQPFTPISDDVIAQAKAETDARVKVAAPETVAAFYSAQKEDESFYSNDIEEAFLDDIDTETPEADANLDDVTYDNADGESLHAVKFSAVGGRLTLFIISMLALGLFGMIFGASLSRIDWLILLVVCIFTGLTIDMSFNASLIVSGVILIGCFISFIIDIIAGDTVQLFRLVWFVLAPLAILSASALVQKIKEIVLANQLLNQELDELFPNRDIDDYDENAPSEHPLENNI